MIRLIHLIDLDIQEEWGKDRNNTQILNLKEREKERNINMLPHQDPITEVNHTVGAIVLTKITKMGEIEIIENNIAA